MRTHRQRRRSSLPSAHSHLARRVAGLSGLRRLLAALAAGAATALAQPPFSWPVVLFVALPLLLWLLDGTRGPRGAFVLGWLAGAAHWAAGLFWIVEPFFVEPEVFGWMAPFALVGMAGGLALFWAAPFALARGLAPPGLHRALALAALWALSDYARGHVLTGFPWALPAYAWVETPVIQTAALGGPWLLSFATLVAALLPGAGGLRTAGIAAALVAMAWGWGAWRLAQPLPERDPALRVRLVQPDAAQAQKWLPGMQQEFYNRHIALTSERDGPPPDVTIWSETAVPFLLGEASVLEAESAAAAQPGRLILGIRRRDGERWYNALAVLDPDGAAAAVYDKHHLVPFGEYIPGARLVARLGLPGITPLTRGGFSAGPGPRLISVPGLPPFLPLICYEAIFPGALSAPGGRADWLVQVTNDAWFGEVAGPWQHFAQARVRAVEQGLPLARVANTGISAMIDPLGRVTARLGLGEVGRIDAVLPSALPATPYFRHGDIPFLILAPGLLMLTASAYLRRISQVFNR